MFTAYFDESGTLDEGTFVSVAGFVARDDAWERFDRQWKAALSKHGAPPLHTTDLTNFKRSFRGWTKSRRDALMADIVAVIHGCGRVAAVGAVMSAADFRSFSKPEQDSMHGPLFPLLQTVLWGAGLEAYFETPGTQVRMVYSRQDEHEADMRRLGQVLRRRDPRMGAMEFRDMRQTPGLQAADLLAWELRRYYVNRVKRPDLPIRWPLLQVVLHQRMLGVQYLRCMSRFRLWLNLQPPWLFHMVNDPTTAAIALAGWFWPGAFTWAMGAPRIPDAYEDAIRDLELRGHEWMLP